VTGPGSGPSNLYFVIRPRQLMLESPTHYRTTAKNMSEPISARPTSQGPYRFAVLTSCFIVLLMMAGALVTSNDAADSVPDWPLSRGLSSDRFSWLIPPMIGGIRFEYTHRVVAAIVSILVFVLAVWITTSEKRPLAKKLGWAAFGLVIAQAVLGGIRVLYGYPAITATAHAVLAQTFFITVVGLALYLSPWWQRELPQLDDNATPSAREMAAWTTGVIFAQLIMGAAYRHGLFGLWPHLVGAGIVTVMVVLAGRVVKGRFREVPELRRAVKYLHMFFGIQILLGGVAYWSIVATADYAQPTLMYVIPTVAHVLGGALTLAASFILSLTCYRLIRPPAAMAAGAAVGSGQGARA
jgi:cytochrome c oxidase assembly protein subunit 15